MLSIFEKIKQFSKTKISKEIKIYAPIDGEIVGIEEVADIVFAEKVLGDGIAILPTGDTVFAPINGIISKFFDTNHAFAIESIDGLQILIHIGLDTIDLKGEGFIRLVDLDTPVKKGDPILKFDLPILKEKCKSIISPVIISNMDMVKGLHKKSGHIKANESVIFSVKI